MTDDNLFDTEWAPLTGTISTKALTFTDVGIAPKYSDIPSRNKIDISTYLGEGFRLSIPVICSNMPAVVNEYLASFLDHAGAGAILHRFQSIESEVEQFKFCCIPSRICNVGVSIGVKENEEKRFCSLYGAGARIFCIDVAHGHHEYVCQMIQWIKSKFDDVYLIAGNVCTFDGAKDLDEWGADCIKVGIGTSSKICSTRIDTGVGIPQLTALEECREATNKPIICDGGCYQTGDFAKALKYSNAVMSGSLFAGTDLSNGKIKRKFDWQTFKFKKMKEYYGSASLKNKGEKRHIEGRCTWVPYKGRTEEVLKKTVDGLRGSFSYVGAENLIDFQKKCTFREISLGGHHEGVR